MNGTTAAVWTYAKSVVAIGAAALLGAFLASGNTDVFTTSWSDWKTYLAVAVAAVVPVIITALNPSDARYGVNK